MKVAIYARYSSENQSEKSIDDQIRVCKNYAQNNSMTTEDKHIYIDEAISGSIINRPALQALQIAAENKEFEAVMVDDLSRLSRSNHQMLTLVLKFDYLQIKIVSVSDGIITDDENSKLGIHIRGLMNELYLDDLKKKTMRGLEGQKIRGFSAGEKVYGYSTHPVGEIKLNKKGQPKYDGMMHKIYPEEADVVKRMYKEFVEGKSLNKIAQRLNEDKIPTKKGLSGGWNLSSISRILKNEKYVGRWVWKKHKNVKDPMTGRTKRILRPENEWLCSFKEELIIINKEDWGKAKKRWIEIKGTWPVRKKSKNSTLKQRSYVHSCPTYLLSGLMRCQSCGGAIILISGKGCGYYGCANSKRKTCNNNLLVPRKRVEKIIISKLKEKILTLENLSYVYQKVEKLVASGMNEVPELVKKKKSQYDKASIELQNYLNYIKMGNFSKAVSGALKEAETKTENLKAEIESLEFQKQNNFKSPPKEWIKHRLENLHETLDKNTISSALALKEILGTIQLEPVSDRNEDIDCIINNRKDFKPYYIAHTKVQTLALLDDKDKGSNWSRWWRRGESNPGP
ncbi:MAG: recombinase family protein [Candidatus Omnitrophica bacterium]|nr:recombinase family protein [Candidatus Omnitrophota bacterium]